jgi:hypothetical protein
MHVRNAGQYEIGLRALTHDHNRHLLLEDRVCDAQLKSIHRRNEELYPRREYRRG